ncbi:LysR family transcriptional regulator [Pseudorhodoplanes sinuspersici]|uniref:Uncharacterized protein n=1 Tax=Pseudorhodoplanes sinuspersici TaxID=1235591 RepID=A0A1W6ZPZ8_9HYPH|nr:LysR family transcriptional regulator [Pseudorhodoplanes sinuspersici]ARP99402.1 hypothetical protein CAK95_10130 [Pseudorhodoplanes sinuspersici]RKE70342.1 LysR family transcriptional regulator [Pseudorhodoplanes sinuspersici]
MSNKATLRQIQAVIAVCEEGSFTRAAEREHATQSGISQHVSAVEKLLGVRLFDRTATGVTPTPAGLRYYRQCVDAIGMLERAGEDMRALAGTVTGPLRIGLMPTFTRAALAPTLQHFVPAYPDVRLHIIEAYSGMLTDKVLADELDFAIVPAFEGRVGLKSRLILRDREVLISGPASGFKPLRPLRLSECAPLTIVVPGPENVRRRNLEVYFQTNGVRIDRMIEMDAMMATFDFVSRTDFVTILPGLICMNDIGSDTLTVNPIVDPPLYAEFIVITPSRRTLSTPAKLFLERFEEDLKTASERLTVLLNTAPASLRSSPRKRGPRVTGFPPSRE